jgi:hypothetical protein
MTVVYEFENDFCKFILMSDGTYDVEPKDDCDMPECIARAFRRDRRLTWRVGPVMNLLVRGIGSFGAWKEDGIDHTRMVREAIAELSILGVDVECEF